jgi:hypothetical protein
MTANRRFGERLQLGEVVVAACELGSRVAGDPATAAELAARRLERVLVRGGNLRLEAALAELANELRPTRRYPGSLPGEDVVAAR